MRRLFSLFAFSAVVLGCTQTRVDPATSRTEPPPPYTLERFRDEAKIADGVETLIFDNPYGEITVRQTSAGAVAWQGVEQRIGANPRIARIEPIFERTQQGVRIRYPGMNPDQPANPRLGRVDLYAFVPPGYSVDLRSDFGTITTRRIKDDVRARSRSGMIVVSNRGSIDAESVTGEIRAFPMQGLSIKPSRIHTGGNVLVDIPVFDDVTVEAQSGGEFRSDLEMDELSTGPDGITRASWRHGSGAHRIRLTSGSSVILQMLKNPIP